MRPLLYLPLLFSALSFCQAQDQLPTVQTEGGLKFATDSRGNRLPDYSYCGYRACEEPLPDVPTKLSIAPSGQDDTQALRDAVAELAALPADSNGWHGALELAPGEFNVTGSIDLNFNGIVLRGTRNEHGEPLTTINAIGNSRRPLITVGSKRTGQRNQQSISTHEIFTDAPVGSSEIQFQPGSPPPFYSVGDTVSLEIQSPKSWIAALEMDRFPSDDNRGSWLDWKPGTLNQTIVRTVKQVGSRAVTFDAPIMCELNRQLTPVIIRPVSLQDTTRQVGVEHLRLISQVDRATNPKDEEHAWDGVRIMNAQDVWIRNLQCRQFAGSAVRVTDGARRATVVDCRSSQPVSEDAGWRRRTFVTAGQQTLFLRCQAEDGRHDFCTEALAAGPNAFVHCRAVRSARFSGPVGSWCTGVLYDNVEIDGASLELNNLETAGQGIGWAAANCTLWNCVAPQLTVRRPPTAYNWAVGVWGEVTGDGLWAQLNEFVSPDSLYEYQLSQRIGKAPARSVLEASAKPNSTLSDAPRTVKSPTQQPPEQNSGKAKLVLQLQDGQLTMGPAPGPAPQHPEGTIQRRALKGTRMQMSWWRGSVLPSKVAEFGPGLTRFVPGHDERFYTDDLGDVIGLMQANGHVAIDHHWGLWYDRRRDDHQMVRRLDGEAWPPFYEHPWARSGIGTGYDGLSKYDLTRFNPWYFGRLKEFARLAEEHGVVLVEHMYFQHNILEAGAHWAEFPWRPANCLQATGFPEPPTYQNRKRVFMADDFYDVTHSVRRDLHTRYIRHCLDELGASQNVLFVLGEEFTGPAHFMRFWLETIGKWQLDTGRDVLVVLSATRDVQEEILKDPELLKLIDAIEIKYWWYTKEGPLYDPPGGQNLAPRQQLREWKGPKNRSAESIARSVQDLRSRFPDKAIISNFPEAQPFNP